MSLAVAPVVALVLACAAGCGPVLLPKQPQLRPSDAIVVLGSRPPADAQGRPTPEIRRRVDAGVSLYRAGVASRMVMTGGPSPDGRIESEVMKAYAVSLGVPPGAIATERDSRDTIGNARGTLTLLCEGQKPDDCRPKVIVVSSPYHLRRARRLFSCAGADVQVFGSVIPDDQVYRVGFVVREHLVRVYYLFRDSCAEADWRRSDTP